MQEKVNFPCEGRSVTMGEKIRVVAVRPRTAPEVIEIENALEPMWQLVEGYIETLPIWIGGKRFLVVCNEEGKLNDLPIGRVLFDDDGNLIDLIYGNFFITKEDGDEFGSLDDEEIEIVLKKFERPIIAYPMTEEVRA